jgi:hypothetical protein
MRLIKCGIIALLIIIVSVNASDFETRINPYYYSTPWIQLVRSTNQSGNNWTFNNIKSNDLNAENSFQLNGVKIFNLNEINGTISGADVVGYVGNWSSDKASYTTITGLLSNITSANISIKSYVDNQHFLKNHTYANFSQIMLGNDIISDWDEVNKSGGSSFYNDTPVRVSYLNVSSGGASLDYIPKDLSGTTYILEVPYDSSGYKIKLNLGGIYLISDTDLGGADIEWLDSTSVNNYFRLFYDNSTYDLQLIKGGTGNGIFNIQANTNITSKNFSISNGDLLVKKSIVNISGKQGSIGVVTPGGKGKAIEIKAGQGGNSVGPPTAGGEGGDVIIGGGPGGTGSSTGSYGNLVVPTNAIFYHNVTISDYLCDFAGNCINVTTLITGGGGKLLSFASVYEEPDDLYYCESTKTSMECPYGVRSGPTDNTRCYNKSDQDWWDAIYCSSGWQLI